ncbi:hypothetical protein ACFE04_004381 [Oxalis oulophora]
MGCICSKRSTSNNNTNNNNKVKNEKESSKYSSKREEVVIDIVGVRGSYRGKRNDLDGVDYKKDIIVGRPSVDRQQRRDVGNNGVDGTKLVSRIVSVPHSIEGEQIAAGWPSWLTSVAAEAIQGWVPRRTDSFEKLKKIGQGTYSNVYKARDLETGKIVAVKKVRFVNLDADSVRFMAREITILRRLDHPNVMKLESIVTSKNSASLYLVFEYMDHDLAGLSAAPTVQFSEAQIKCYMQQLFHGLEHCHSRGVLHRDIKGSNLLIDKDGILKIGDFGLATFFHPDQDQPLTSRVVTLWYRPPELLLGATEYGVAIDLWSAGCIIAELFAGKPIMPGQTEVEQMHKIFKLCGSPCQNFWQNTKLKNATSFKPQQPYKRRVTETFKTFPPSALALVDKLLAFEPDKRGTTASALASEFFTTDPLPCEPSSLPKYSPSKELDVKIRNEEARRQKSEAVKGRGPESVRRGSRDFKEVPSPEFITQQTKTISSSHKPETNVQHRQERKAHPQSSSVVHPSAGLWNKNGSSASSRYNADLRIPTLNHDLKKDDKSLSTKESAMGYVPKKNRIHYSGPLMPPGGNIEDVLKEHERQIQQAVRKARLEKNGTNKNNNNSFYHHQHGKSAM